MKVINVLILSLLILSSSKCEKEDCNRSVTIINNSNQDVIVATFTIGGEAGTCGFNKHMTLKKSIISYPLTYFGRECIEEIYNPTILPIYILDPLNYTKEIIDCDSLLIYNTVLKEYILTKDSLIKTNFTITYP